MRAKIEHESALFVIGMDYRHAPHIGIIGHFGDRFHKTRIFDQCGERHTECACYVAGTLRVPSAGNSRLAREGKYLYPSDAIRRRSSIFRDSRLLAP